jgi:HAMP domain-containing protein
MRLRIATIGATVMLVTLLLFSAACDQETTAEKRENLCSELAELNTDIENLENIGPTSTVGELEDAEEAVREQAEEVRRAFRALEESKADDLKQAVDNLESSVSNIPSNMTVAEAKAAIAQNLVATRAAATALTTRFQCL